MNVTVGGGTTVTVAVFVAVPPVPLAVSVYVVVTPGETLAVPEAGLLPTPLSMVIVVAFVVDQVSVDDAPRAMVVGLALKVAVGTWLTVIVTCAVRGLLSAVPVALHVYVVVTVGLTLMELFGGRAPIPLSSVALFPPVLQVSVADCPDEIVSGEPVNENMHPCPDEMRSEKVP